ncbi:MAG: DUF4190 domain-containing protein [Kiritimatiellia bacterium]|jgi:hypothetical protein
MTTSQKQTVGTAVASLVLGILGLILIGPLGSVPAVICGHIAKSRIKKNPDMLTGDGMALAGLFLGYLQIGITVVVMILTLLALPSFLNARDTAQLHACINNMKKIDSAKEQVALSRGCEDGAEITEEEIAEYITTGLLNLVCPKNGIYTINPLGQSPSCSKHGTLEEAMEGK